MTSLSLVGASLGVIATTISSVNYQSIQNLNNSIKEIENINSELLPNLPVKTNDEKKFISAKIVDSDIQNSTISNEKLATQSATNNPNYIVSRNSLGNFETNMITIEGTTSYLKDVDIYSSANITDAIS